MTATGGDISRDGGSVLIRTYDRAYFWTRAAGMPLGQALAAAPTPVSLVPEPKGEGIGFDRHGLGFFTLSEGSHPYVFFYERR